LSYAAAYMLGFHEKGTAMVEVEAVMPGEEPMLASASAAPATAVAASTSAAIARSSTAAAPAPAVPSGSGQYLQVGAFADLGAARRLSEKLRSMTSRPVFIRSVDANDTTLHRVRIGPIPEVTEISRITELVVAADLGRPYTVRD